MDETAEFDFTTFPVLTTERLRLRELRPTDAPDTLEFRGDPEVQRYNGPTLSSVGEAERLIEDVITGFADKAGVVWAVTHKGSDAVLGLFGLHSLNASHRRAEVGYDLARAQWGRGIATEALRAVVRFGFERLDLHRLEAYTIADNHPSVRLLERVGFRREGTKREVSLEEDGAFHDGAVYGLLRREFGA